MKRTTLGLTVATILAGAVIGCGGTPPPAATVTATTAAPKATAAATTPAPAATTPAAAAAASTATMIAVEEGDSKYSYDPNKLTLKAGEVTVKLTNKAGNQRPHTLFVKDASGKEIAKSERVQPGASLDVKFTVAEAGTYQFYCNLMGHADKGQTGVLTVVKG
ncbi:MAG: hypothetical protein DWI58_18145 [Chloroflexi bacterium]|nr:MAG: hypothetical protein DWI58_18145 [Chloroflexota bacterium]